MNPIPIVTLETDRWYAPRDVLEIAKAEDDLDHARHAKKAREAWIFAHVCTALGLPRLMVNSDETFDVCYELDDELRQVEVSELLDEGRKRNEEHAEGAPNVRSMPINKEDIRIRIVDAVATKADRNKRRFQRGVIADLSLYLNLNLFRNVTDEVEEGVRLSFTLEQPFSRIYVLNGLHNVICGSWLEDRIRIVHADVPGGVGLP